MGALVIHAVGDVGPRRREPGSIFARARMEGGDILFGQMECVLTEHAHASPHAKLAMRSTPETAAALKAAGFGVMSVAGNHAMDFGAQGMTDTLAALRGAGIATCGGGGNLVEARRPAIIEAAGRRVAFLGYSSILPAGYAAEANRPGCAPMWAHTHYEQVEPDQPGTPARVRTFAEPAHLAALCEDVRAAKDEADIVAVSLHWGVHFVRAVLADYQREVAHAAIDAGADMIIGHHPHILKAVEVYRGKPVFYSLGNFAIEQPSAFKEDVHLDAAFRDISRLGGKWSPGERYMIPPETRHTLVARLVVEDRRVAVRMRPHWIDDNSDPQALEPGDPRFGAALAYLADVTAEAGVATRFVEADGEIAIG